MEFIKATDRIPDHFRDIPIKIDGTYSVGRLRYNDRNFFTDDSGDSHPIDQVEWLDETIEGVAKYKCMNCNEDFYLKFAGCACPSCYLEKTPIGYSEEEMEAAWQAGYESGLENEPNNAHDYVASLPYSTKVIGQDWVKYEDRMPPKELEDHLVFFDNGEIRRLMENKLPFAQMIKWKPF